jgi:4,5-DOPA dioxygenase extradiol
MFKESRKMMLDWKQQGKNIAFPVEGVDGGSISMLSVCIGGEEAI